MDYVTQNIKKVLYECKNCNTREVFEEEVGSTKVMLDELSKSELDAFINAYWSEYKR